MHGPLTSDLEAKAEAVLGPPRLSLLQVRRLRRANTKSAAPAGRPARSGESRGLAGSLGSLGSWRWHGLRCVEASQMVDEMAGRPSFERTLGVLFNGKQDERELP